MKRPGFRNCLGALGIGLAFALHPLAAVAGTPLIPGYGHFTVIDTPGNPPDPRLDYKVVMSVTKAGEPGAPVQGLDRAARLANLLADAGVDAAHRHLEVILYGPATQAVLNPVGVHARGREANPNADLIAKLIAAGVQVHVCGQALAAAKINREEVLPGIIVDTSALVTLSTLQLKGYAALSD
jgi:intracellular sulfur oxidation DsrE/DsrF family protein